VIDGAMNGPMLLGDVEQNPCPTLERGETVIMDNLSVLHKVAGVREAIEAAGAYMLYLPSLAFSKLKALAEGG
jgi:hypothetical protein